ncbi:MAG: transketolase [Bacillota bacterium]
MDEKKAQELKETAKKIRAGILKALGASKSGHPGGSLSLVEIMTVLYFHVMKIDPQKPDWPERDRFVLSKGHGAPVLYAALAARGFFPMEDIMSLRRLGSKFQGHPDMNKTPGVDMSTGSLGQGISAANGMALGLRLNGSTARVFVVLGDGECEEGQVWEAAMTAAHYRLDNLTAFLDYNHLQIDGKIEDVKSLTDLAGRFRAFGWHVIEVDGHDIPALAFAAGQAQTVKGKPSLLVCHTVKGKGVSFMEGQVGWHGTAPKPEEVEKALGEIFA